jgi:hypothetical protein
LAICFVFWTFSKFEQSEKFTSNTITKARHLKIIIPPETPKISRSAEATSIPKNLIFSGISNSSNEDLNLVSLPSAHSETDFQIKLDLTTTIKSPRIAFLILAHTHETCQNVQEMIKTLYSPKHYFILHLDKKLRFPESVIGDSENANKLKGIVDFDPDFSGKSCELSLTMDYPNVFFAKERINVQWGTMSIMEAELSAMKTAMEIKDWDYVMNICGSSWPVRTADVMSHYITKYFKKDSNMIFWGGIPTPCPNENNVCDRFNEFCVDGR